MRKLWSRIWFAKKPGEGAWFSLGILIFALWLHADCWWTNWPPQPLFLAREILVAAAMGYFILMQGVFLKRLGYRHSRLRWIGLAIILGIVIFPAVIFCDSGFPGSPATWLKSIARLWDEAILPYLNEPYLRSRILFVLIFFLPLPELWRHFPKLRPAAVGAAILTISSILLSQALETALLVSASRAHWDYRGRFMGFDPDDITAHVMRLLNSNTVGWICLILLSWLAIAGMFLWWGYFFGKLSGRTVRGKAVGVLFGLMLLYGVALQVNLQGSGIAFRRAQAQLEEQYERPFDPASLREYYLNGRFVTSAQLFSLPSDSMILCERFFRMTPAAQEKFVQWRNSVDQEWKKLETQCNTSDYRPYEPDFAAWQETMLRDYLDDAPRQKDEQALSHRVRTLNEMIYASAYQEDYAAVRRYRNCFLPIIDRMAADGNCREWAEEVDYDLTVIEMLLESGTLTPAEEKEFAALLQAREAAIPALLHEQRYLDIGTCLMLFQHFIDGKFPLPQPEIPPIPVGPCRLLLPAMATKLQQEAAEALSMRAMPTISEEGWIKFRNKVLWLYQIYPIREYHAQRWRNRLIARLRAVEALLEIHRFKREHGNWPEHWDHLPEDPFTGKPMYYRNGKSILSTCDFTESDIYPPFHGGREDAPAVQVWSVGANGVDDGGGDWRLLNRTDDIRAVIRKEPRRNLPPCPPPKPDPNAEVLMCPAEFALPEPANP